MGMTIKQEQQHKTTIRNLAKILESYPSAEHGKLHKYFRKVEDSHNILFRELEFMEHMYHSISNRFHDQKLGVVVVTNTDGKQIVLNSRNIVFLEPTEEGCLAHLVGMKTLALVSKPETVMRMISRS